jgi:hypothetical protein
MIRILLLLHLAGFALALGGMVAQLALIARHRRATGRLEPAPEKAARIILSGVQMPGVYFAIATGVALTGLSGWDLLSRGWLQFKLLFVFWIWLATRLMTRNVTQMDVLRAQSELSDPRLQSLADNHRMIGYVTAVVFVFVMTFSIWQPF